MIVSNLIGESNSNGQTSLNDSTLYKMPYLPHWFNWLNGQTS